MSGGAVLLDKDGTLVQNVPGTPDPADFQLTQDSLPALQRLDRAGFRLAIISNQPGVAFGRYPERALRVMEVRLREALATAGVRLAGLFYCPHHPQAPIGRY